jgi:inosose dehydratase
MNSPQRALYLLREVPSPRIRLVYDYSHFRAEGFTLEESLRQLIPSTVFISVKDSTGHAGSQRYLLPGEGDTDYARYFQLLSELRYSGGIGVEVSSMIHRQPGYDPVRTTQVCYERIAPFFGRSGLVRTRMPR